MTGWGLWGPPVFRCIRSNEIDCLLGHRSSTQFPLFSESLIPAVHIDKIALPSTHWHSRALRSLATTSRYCVNCRDSARTHDSSGHRYLSVGYMVERGVSETFVVTSDDFRSARRGLGAVVLRAVFTRRPSRRALGSRRWMLGSRWVQ